jgi:hypothetical protein
LRNLKVEEGLIRAKGGSYRKCAKGRGCVQEWNSMEKLENMEIRKYNKLVEGNCAYN